MTCVWRAKSTKALFRFDSIPGPGHYHSSPSARVVRRNTALFFSSLFLPAVDPLSKCFLYCHEYRPFLRIWRETGYWWYFNWHLNLKVCVCVCVCPRPWGIINIISIVVVIAMIIVSTLSYSHTHTHTHTHARPCTRARTRLHPAPPPPPPQPPPHTA